MKEFGSFKDGQRMIDRCVIVFLIAFAALANTGLQAALCYHPPHPTDAAEAVAIQPDGKIVVAGRAGPGQGNFGLARYLPDGSLDPSFGTGGTLTDSLSFNDSIFDVTILSDGKILVTGNAEGLNVPDGPVVFADQPIVPVSTRGSVPVHWTDFLGFTMVRYLPDGSRDPSFGFEGRVYTGYRDAKAAAIQPDGKILVVARIFDFVLARFNPNGSPDTTFGDSGEVTTDFGGGEQAKDVLVQPDGMIVVAGSTRQPHPGNIDFALARYTADGVLDPDFGTGGKVITDLGGLNDVPGTVILQPDGKILAGGYSSESSRESVFALVRYFPDGGLDPGFADNGVFHYGFDGFRDSIADLAVQADGKIIAAGEDRKDNGRETDFALVRLNSDGSLDPAFGSGGSLTTDIGGPSDWLYGVAIQSDQSIIAVGRANDDFALVRYLADGSLDPAFGTGGIVTTDLAGPPPPSPPPVAPLPDNRIGRHSGELKGLNIRNRSGAEQAVHKTTRQGRPVGFFLFVANTLDSGTMCHKSPDTFHVRAVGRGRNFKIDYFRKIGSAARKNVTAEIMGPNGITVEDTYRGPAAEFEVRIRPRRGIRRSKTVMITTTSEANPDAKDVVKATVFAK